MYCCECGVLLQGENEAGLSCVNCKKIRQSDKIRKNKPMQVKFCFRCGEPFESSDNAVSHILLLGGGCNTWISNEEIQQMVRELPYHDFLALADQRP